MSKMDKRVYYEALIKQIPRLLGQLDRNKSSKTYGCFDRNYWHYKLTDFPCARHQEAALTLALLYKLNQKDNPYFNNKNILRWMQSSLKFWCEIQNKEGSFNEWYPNEKSFVATAFSSYAVSECLIMLKDEVEDKKNIIISLQKSGDWIMQYNDWNATNQMSGAVTALYNIYVITKNKNYLRACQEKLNKLISRQTPEGWWNEYNGMDVGYLSLTIDYLSKLLVKYPNHRLKKSIDNAIDFLSYFMHPNMTFGGEYGSRNTEYIIPHGIELNAGRNKNAATIAHAVRNSLIKHATISPNSIDDRYLCYIAYGWLQTYLSSKNLLSPPKYKFHSSFQKDFQLAKILIISNHNFYVIINYSKGGAFSIYLKKGNTYLHDSGILVADQKNNYLTSSWISGSKVEKNNSSITIKGNLMKIKERPMTSFKSIGLRVFAKTVGNSQKISSLIKNHLRRMLITKPVKSDIEFTRTIAADGKSIKIIDLLSSKNKIKDVILGEKYSSIFIPSSRYFQLQELDNKPLEFRNLNKKIFKVERVFSSDKLLRVKTF